MFESLRKQLSTSAEKLSKKVTEKTLTEEDIDDFFSDYQLELLQANVALEVAEHLKNKLKEELVGKDIKRRGAERTIRRTFREALMDILDQGEVDLEETIRKARKEDHPALIVFLGFNGTGKTTTLAKIAKYLKDRGHWPVLAAGDTYRAASIEQLETHGKELGLKTIKHQYKADSAAVVFDAVKYAKANDKDVILADTAGRSHANKNLMDELEKVIRVNKPDLKILVVDSLTGNDVLQQVIKFDETVGVDTMVFTKIDVNKKGGSLLSACYAAKKPILFLGTGQNYEDLEVFDANELVKNLLEQ